MPVLFSDINVSELGDFVCLASPALKRLNSSLALVDSQIKLNPNWVTGFIDGEGCFSISVRRRLKSKLG